MKEPLDCWIEANASQLEKCIETHLRIYGLKDFNLEQATRMIMISIKQWEDEKC